MATETTFQVNGAETRVSTDSRTPLLYVLRNHLDLKGPRYGCGLGQCGACAVLMNGREIRSCITPLSAARGKSITTVEGLAGLWAQHQTAQRPASSQPSPLHPVQQAWIEEQVPQCGYCQSGMMIAAVDLLQRNPNPSVEQIKDAFTNTPPSPHLCRCGTYCAIIAAVQRAAKQMSNEKAARP